MRSLLAGSVLWIFATAASSQEAAPPTRLPVKEITVFKDGHSLVLREEGRARAKA